MSPRHGVCLTSLFWIIAEIVQTAQTKVPLILSVITNVSKEAVEKQTEAVKKPEQTKSRRSRQYAISLQ